MDFTDPTWAAALRVAWPRLPYSSTLAIRGVANDQLKQREDDVLHARLRAEDEKRKRGAE